MPPRAPQPGESVPWFHIRAYQNPRFCFDTLAGRYVVLSFFGSASQPLAQQMLSELQSVRYLFDDDHVAWCGVSIDPQDAYRLTDSLPGMRFFYDDDQAISKLYGVADANGALPYAPQTFILDQRLRVVEVLPLRDPAQHVLELAQRLAALQQFAPPAPATIQAPILVVPRLFEPELCRTLMAYYDERGGRRSGFMREVDGRTVEILDPSHKIRHDVDIEDEPLRRTCMVRLHDRLVPELRKAFAFEATRIERYMVACYQAEVGGHFRAHRDNTTKGTAHRRFAVSLNLNTGAYEGGEILFPEYGQQRYNAPPGGAVVFSCSLLHEATPVISGSRYVFLPFLYDEAAARIRQQNAQFLGPQPPT